MNCVRVARRAFSTNDLAKTWTCEF